MTLREAINNSKNNHSALGHFNFSTVEVLLAIVKAAQNVNVPVIVGLSEGERDFIGIENAFSLVESIKKSTSHPVYLNADHTYSFEKVKKVIDSGYDSVIFDGAQLSHKENINLANKCVEYARNQQRDILIEAEIGYIGTSSSLLDEIPPHAAITQDLMPSPQAILNFVKETGVDMIAPAVGNIHGMLKNSTNPKLNIDLIKSITDLIDAPFVLHGGSGISNQDFSNAINAGVRIIHINTHLRIAWKEALTSTLTNNPDQIAPYKILSKSQSDVQIVVEDFLRLFNR